MGGLQTKEFRRSLENTTPRAVTFVIDKRRQWFNTTHARIGEALARLVRPGQQVVTLGNSMGGFGAFLFAGAIPGCTRAIAFAPQFSVHPRHMPRLETRWAAFRNAIAPHRLQHALEFPSAEVDYIAFFGADEDLDRRHAVGMGRVATPRTYLFLVAGATHAVARHMKRAGALQPLLDRLIDAEHFEPEEMARQLRGCGLRVGRRLSAHFTGPEAPPA